MKPGRSWLAPVLLLLALAAGGFAWREYLEVQRLRARLLGADERASLDRRIQADDARIRQLQAGLGAGASGDQVGSAQPGGPRPAGPGAFEAIMNNPQARKLQAAVMQGGLDARYGALFKALGLTAEQLAQFKSLLVEKEQAVMDAMAAARDQGLSPFSDPDAFRQAVQDAQASTDDQIKALLGDSGYSQYQQYEQTLPERTLVTQLQQSLSYTSSPLTDDQASQLVEAFSQSASQASGDAVAGPPPGPGSGGPGSGSEAVTSQVLTAAQSVLSSSQLAALQQIQSQQQAQQQLGQLMRASLQDSGPAR